MASDPGRAPARRRGSHRWRLRQTGDGLTSTRRQTFSCRDSVNPDRSCARLTQKFPHACAAALDWFPDACLCHPFLRLPPA
ncbi:unnamed protein product [Urochloa humidicola]